MHGSQYRTLRKTVKDRLHVFEGMYHSNYVPKVYNIVYDQDIQE